MLLSYFMGTLPTISSSHLEKYVVPSLHLSLQCIPTTYCKMVNVAPQRHTSNGVLKAQWVVTDYSQGNLSHREGERERVKNNNILSAVGRGCWWAWGWVGVGRGSRCPASSQGINLFQKRWSIRLIAGGHRNILSWGGEEEGRKLTQTVRDEEVLIACGC